VTLGLVHVQRIVARLPTEARAPDDAEPAKPASLVPLLLGTLLVALGFQVHYFLNSKAQYLRFLDPADLVWVLPLFWVGFKLLVFPGSTAASRYGPLKVMVAAAALGGLGLVGAALAPSLGELISAQMLAGGCWGVAFMAGISAALGMGSSGREGLVLGLWFTMVSLASAVRVGLAIGGPKLGPGAAELLPWMPVAAWAAGAAILANLGWRYRPRLVPSEISV